MAEFLPWLFVVLAVIGIVGGLFGLWVSLSLALSGDTGMATRANLTTEARLALLTEKEGLLEELRDIAFERDAGKLSEEDYQELNEKLRGQARHVLHELDAGAEGFRDEAERLIAQRLEEEA